jgi:hypothetical protein
MKTTMLRMASRVADAVHEAQEAQRLMFALRNATDRHIANPDAAPDTYQEFLARTSGPLLHEASARKRIRRGRRG